MASRINGRIALFHGRAAEKPALRRSFEGWMTKTRPKVYLVFLEAASPQMWSPPRCGLLNAPRTLVRGSWHNRCDLQLRRQAKA